MYAPIVAGIWQGDIGIFSDMSEIWPLFLQAVTGSLQLKSLWHIGGPSCLPSDYYPKKIPEKGPFPLPWHEV